ncbi:MAG TPA: HAMP domain-containing protein, partial [Mycobacteriales bacterium]|nr:HAMP domain-containing protein [Mycobacteriales bacterium]
MSGVTSVGQRLSAPGRRWHTAPLRTRLTAAAALAATISIVGVIAVAYFAVHHVLLGNIDSQLRQQAHNVDLGVTPNPVGVTVHIPSEPDMVAGPVQAVSSDGQHSIASVILPVSTRDDEIAAHGGQWLRSARLADGTPERILTVHRTVDDGEGGTIGIALQVALPLNAVESQLQKLTFAFLLLGLLGFGTVIAGSWLVVRRMMRPVASLTEAAEQIAVTRDLATRIDDYGDDELGRLAVSF